MYITATGYCQMVRIWSIHPRFLDRMGMLGYCFRRSHLFYIESINHLQILSQIAPPGVFLFLFVIYDNLQVSSVFGVK